MAETAQHIALGAAHMRRQVQGSTAAQAALAAAWKRTVRPNDIDGTFLLFLRYALSILQAGRASGILTASEYYSETRRISGLNPAIPRIGNPDLDIRMATEALLLTGPVRYKEALTAGESQSAAITAAQVGMLQTGKRLVLEAPRETVIRLSDKDQDAEGWARVSDGKPCYFCAMLLSRGPVYSEETVRFKAHNGCGCQPRPFFKHEKDSGWSPDALELRKLWDDEAGGNPALFRSAYNLKAGNTKTRRLTAETARKSSGSRRKPSELPAATPEQAKHQIQSQLTALEETLAGLKARAARGEDLSTPIEWQEQRIAALRAKL